MQQFTQEIVSFIDGPILSLRNDFSSIAETLGFATTTTGDQTFSDLITSTNHSINILKEAASKEIIDALSPNVRSYIRSQISSLTDRSNELFISKSTTDITGFVDAANNVMAFVDQYSLDFQLKNIPDYKKKLEEIKQLRKKLDALTIDNARAKIVLSQSEEIWGKLTAKLAENIAAQTDISEIVANAKKLFTTLEESNNQIKGKIIEIESFYTEKFKILNEQILNSDKGLQATLDYAASKQSEIKTLFNKADSNFKQLENSVAEYGKVLEKLNTANAAIQDLFDKVNDPEEGIEHKLAEVTSTKAKVDEIYFKAGEAMKAINLLELNINGISKNAEKNLENIILAEATSTDIQRRIDNIFKTVIPKAQGGMFDRTRKTFFYQQMIWLSLIVIAIAITTLIAYNLYFSMINSPNNVIGFENILLRYATLSPLIFLIIFCSNQYKNSRISYEKYTFKSVLAFSVIADIGVLQDKFNTTVEHKDGIFEFAVKTFEKIYDVPYFDKSMELNYKIRSEEIKYGNQKDENTIVEKQKEQE